MKKEEIISPINGKLTVVKDLAWGTYIKGGGLTQSGGVAEKVWKTALKEVRSQGLEARESLILGLGGGGAAKLIRKYWPEAKITGVEIDPIMVDLGKKYLGLNEAGVDIKIQDAYEYCSNIQNIKYDLILVDLYIGDKVPEKFETRKFLELVAGLLTKDGKAIFNRLYYDEKRNEAEKLLSKLKEIFSKVISIRPEANIMFICSNSDKMDA